MLGRVCFPRRRLASEQRHSSGWRPITGREGCLLMGTRPAVGCFTLAGLFSRRRGWAAGRGAAGCGVGAGSQEAGGEREGPGEARGGGPGCSP